MTKVGLCGAQHHSERVAVYLCECVGVCREQALPRPRVLGALTVSWVADERLGCQHAV